MRSDLLIVNTLTWTNNEQYVLVNKNVHRSSQCITNVIKYQNKVNIN